MRLPVALLAIAATAGCVPDQPSAHNGSIDIDAAANAAQQSVDAYGADGRAADRAARSEVRAEPSPVPEPPASPAPLDPPAPGTPGGLPDDRTPLSEAPFTPDSAQGAANVVQTYYALIGERKFREAWLLWDHARAASGTTAEAFAADFDKFAEYHANVGAPGDIDAGAGQRYVTVPVQVYGRLKRTGVAFHMLGKVTLHRVGDIDGATAAQRTWHIASVDISGQAEAAR